MATPDPLGAWPQSGLGFSDWATTPRYVWCSLDGLRLVRLDLKIAFLDFQTPPSIKGPAKGPTEPHYTRPK